MQKIIKLVVFLALISGLSGLCLSVVNDLTSPIIEEAKLAAVKENLTILYSNGEFKEENISVENGSAIQNVYSVSEGSTVKGYVYKVGVNGYGGEVTFLIGINKDGSYQGFVALSYDSETSGFGSRIGDEEFSSQFPGKTIDDNVDTLSGATVTSTAVVKGIDQAKTHFAENYR